MASPVDTSVKHFTSTMLNAPVLNGTKGSLVGLLYTLLVTGFDVKAATAVTVASGVATLEFSGTHSAMRDVVILVSGATGEWVGLNGEQKVSVVQSGGLKFATALPDGIATGAISFRMAPLGWQQVYSADSKIALRSSHPASTGMILRVEDLDPQTARVRGFEQMSDIDTGVGGFPSDNQISGGGYWGKSFHANTNPVRWTLVGDARMFFIHISAYLSYGAGYERYATGSLRGFGDMIPLRPSGDAFACALATSPNGQWTSYPHYGSFDLNYGEAVYTPRNYTGLGASYAMTSVPYTGQPGQLSGTDSAQGTFPSRIDGRLRLSRRYLRSWDITQYEPRCDMPGLYTIPQSNVYGQLSHGGIIDGSDALAGRRLLGLAVSTNYGSEPNNINSIGLAMIDITGPWR